MKELALTPIHKSGQSFPSRLEDGDRSVVCRRSVSTGMLSTSRALPNGSYSHARFREKNPEENPIRVAYQVTRIGRVRAATR